MESDRIRLLFSIKCIPITNASALDALELYGLTT